MNCTQFRQLLAGYVSGELPPDQHADVRGHAADCSACADELAGLQSAAAVLDSGRLTEPVCARQAAALSLPTAPPVRASGAAYAFIPSWARYAAVVVLAFSGGYLLRGGGAPTAGAAPNVVATPVTAPAGVIERYNLITRERPQAPAISRSLLALAAPARTNP